MENTVNILVSCRDTGFFENGVFKPIQVGTANMKKRLPGMYHDDEGENDSQLNPMLCEMTAQYWAWKHLDLEYYGFCHYRRFLSFSETPEKIDPYDNIWVPYCDGKFSGRFGLDEKNVQNIVSQYDIVYRRKTDVTKLPPFNAKSVYDHYKKAVSLHIEDIDCLLQILKDKQPDYYPDAVEFFNSKYISFCNLYIMKKEYFFKYCAWVFPILDEFIARTDMTNYTIEALRTPGHLAERLFNIFLNHEMRINPALRTKELPCVLLENPKRVKEDIEPLSFDNDRETARIMLSCDNKFVSILSVCLLSLAEHASADVNYEINILHVDIDLHNQGVLQNLLKSFPNVRLRFVDVGSFVNSVQFVTHAHIPVSTFYRLFAAYIFAGYDKILHLDADMLICDDVAKVYRTGIEDCMVAATHDADGCCQFNGSSPMFKDYGKKTLKLKDQFSYFQAGILLMNLKKIREKYTIRDFIQQISKGYYYGDQDVLNVMCENSVRYLNMRWNVMIDCDHKRMNNIKTYAPHALAQSYLEARRDPAIIHYAGYPKPWATVGHDYELEFWQEARKSPYYEIILKTNGDFNRLNYKGPQSVSKFRKYVDTHMPVGTARRKVLDTILPRDSHRFNVLKVWYHKIGIWVD